MSALVAATALLIASTVASAPLFHVVGNGAYGTAWWSNTDSQGFIHVGRGGTVKNPQTFLYYFICCNTVEGGFGEIPNADLVGEGKHIQLNTNTSPVGNASFYRSSGIGGGNSVSWDADGAMTIDWSGELTESLSSPNIIYHSSGANSYSSASASGSVLGVSLGDSATGSIGRSTSNTVEIQTGSVAPQRPATF
ncbi:MAG TPA: hypothetical protein VGK54_14090 [Chloroflexota bacterium]